MSVFIRRFTSDPGNEVLLEIESVNILDLEPPSPIVGIGAGTAMVVGEFENGPYNAPTEVTGPDDLKKQFGGFGYTRNGVVANDPCARARKADGAVKAENWNGNGAIQLNGKKFRRLVICRVDTSVGTVLLTAAPFLVGAGGPRYDLEPNQILALDVGSGAVSATFTATAATVTGVAGTYPTTFAGGETLVLGFDDQANFTTTFLAADQSNAQVAARINAYAGFAFADVSGGQLRLTGAQRGTGAQVRVVSGSTGVLTKLGLTAATTAGAGNVANIDSVTVAEINTVVSGTGGLGTVKAEAQPDGFLRLSTTSASLTVGNATTAANLGFIAGATNNGSPAADGTVPAGTIVQNSGATVVLVTARDVDVVAGTAGPYSVPVRHATDDGTGLSATAGTITVFPTTPDLGAFSVTNPSLINAALTEPAIDAAYVAAFDSTLDINTVAHDVNVCWSARQSNAVRRTGRQNAIDASANGLFGRMFATRPPLNTTRATATKSDEPGVGAYRDQRTIYCYPGAATFVPPVATRGIAGGVGFTADGKVNVGADGFMCSVLSQLAPEEDPGQLTAFLGGVVSIESGANAQGFNMQDYILFKRNGIAALRMVAGTAVFQSGVTSVDPTVYTGLVNISRRRMADFVEDSLALGATKYGKKLMTLARRKAIVTDVRVFMEGLKGKATPSSQRIDDFSIDEKSGNTAITLGLGIYRLTVRVRLLNSFKSIVLAVTAGETVDVSVVDEAA